MTSCAGPNTGDSQPVRSMGAGRMMCLGLAAVTLQACPLVRQADALDRSFDKVNRTKLRTTPTPLERQVARYLSSRADPRWNVGPEARLFVAEIPADDMVLAWVSAPSSCGTGGCPLLIMRRTPVAIERISRSIRVHLPIRLLHERRNGMPVFGVVVAGGGIPNAYERAIAFDGRRYPPWPEADVSWTVPANADAKILISGQMVPVALR